MITGILISLALVTTFFIGGMVGRAAYKDKTLSGKVKDTEYKKKIEQLTKVNTTRNKEHQLKLLESLKNSISYDL